MRVRKGSSNLAVVLQATAENGRVHAWNHTHLSNDVGNWGQDFQAPHLVARRGPVLRHPATRLRPNRHCRRRVLLRIPQTPRAPKSVAPLANFSTFGPTLDERLKPNVSAPGVSVESSLSSFRDNSYSVTSTVEFDGTTYDFAKLSGTSMSSPATAGVVALMLEANPNLTPADVRAILELTAREDDDTGTLPDEETSFGGTGKSPHLKRH